MKEFISINGKQYTKGNPIDISLPITEKNTRAFWSATMGTSNFISKDGSLFDISVPWGQACNDYVRSINPHTLWTHTETVNHIAASNTNPIDTIKDIIANRLAVLLTLQPTEIYLQSNNNDSDFVITRELLAWAFMNKDTMDTIIIRTLPNSPTKKDKDWSGTNPVYFAPESMDYLCEQWIQHLLFDWPSVDKEDSNGKVPAHSAYRKYTIEKGITEETRTQATITELVYIPSEIADGLYLVNLWVSNIQWVDAAPSRPILYPLTQDLYDIFIL